MANPTAVAPSPARRHSPSIGFFERLPFVAGVAVAILGALVLASWALALPILRSWIPGGFQMLPMTAVSFLLGGSSLAISARARRTATTDAIQQTLAALVATLAVLTLYEYIVGSGSRFDLLLFGSQLHETPWGPPGRIAINSAACLLLYALALLVIPHDQRKADLRAQMFAMPALLIALVAIFGYVFGV